MLGRRDRQTQALQPRLLRLIISQGNLKGDVINSGRCGVESPITGTGGPVEESEDLSMTLVPISDLEEHGVLGSPHHLQANDFLVKLLHGVEVGDPQGDFSQGFDRSLSIGHESPLHSVYEVIVHHFCRLVRFHLPIQYESLGPPASPHRTRIDISPLGRELVPPPPHLNDPLLLIADLDRRQPHDPTRFDPLPQRPDRGPSRCTERHRRRHNGASRPLRRSTHLRSAIPRTRIAEHLRPDPPRG